MLQVQGREFRFLEDTELALDGAPTIDEGSGFVDRLLVKVSTDECTTSEASKDLATRCERRLWHVQRIIDAVLGQLELLDCVPYGCSGWLRAV